MNTIVPKIDIKAKRDEMVAKRALNASNRTKAETAIKIMREYIAKVDPADIEYLSQQGINVNNVLLVDLDKIYVDKDYYDKFIRDLLQVLDALERFISPEGA